VRVGRSRNSGKRSWGCPGRRERGFWTGGHALC
jgi:hypothetical protein